MKGVIRTRVGYAGGTTEYPTYHNIGDHSETIQIDYDPTQVTYEELLDVFWESHRPDFQGSRQYRSAILYHNEQQRQIAVVSKEHQEADIGGKLFTAIEPFQAFTLAEDYHQKYDLRQNKTLLQAYQEIYPDMDDFVNSTAVTRVNGYVAGHGSAEQARAELELLGLSEEARDALQRIVEKLGR
jgi:methionine-S-sulfoxide reductase